MGWAKTTLYHTKHLFQTLLYNAHAFENFFVEDLPDALYPEYVRIPVCSGSLEKKENTYVSGNTLQIFVFLKN